VYDVRMLDVVTVSEISNCLFGALQMYRPDEAAIARSVRYWAGEGLLPPIGGLHTGRGRDRLFKREEILRAAILYQMTKFNVTVGTMKLMMKEIDREIAAVAPNSNLLNLLDNTITEYFVWSTWGYPDTYRLAFGVRNPPPPEDLYPRLSIDARAWRSALNL